MAIAFILSLRTLRSIAANATHEKPMAKAVVRDFDSANFPALYQSADKASTDAHGWYLFWIKANLGLLIIGSLAASVNLANVSQKQVLLSISAVCFFCSLAVSILLASRRWEKIWFAGRAVAESTKSLTWKYIGGADPFGSELPEHEVTERLLSTFGELLAESKSLAGALSPTSGDAISEQMKALRKSAVGVRRDVYLAQRVNDQQAWYANKAATNKRYRNIWFACLVIFQGGAGIAAVTLAMNPMLPWRATAVFSTLASSTIAWGQIKRFQELAQSYGYAAQELSLIAARGPSVVTGEQLSRFVNDAETAVSREHSSWIARRETT